MAALFPIEPIISKTEEGEQTIEALIAHGDSLSIDTALVVANQTIDILIKGIAVDFFSKEEKQVIAEHLTALGIVAIERTDEIIVALTHSHGRAFETLISFLCEMRLAFAASKYDEAGWIRSLENEFPSKEDADTDR